eukprot:748782_1
MQKKLMAHKLRGFYSILNLKFQTTHHKHTFHGITNHGWQISLDLGSRNDHIFLDHVSQNDHISLNHRSTKRIYFYFREYGSPNEAYFFGSWFSKWSYFFESRISK